MVDEITFAPPDDLHFQILMERAVKMKVPVFGVILNVEAVKFVRAYPTHRPEITRWGSEVIEKMRQNWQEGSTVRPWLYCRGKEYVVADDYFWLALIEKFQPESIAAQVLGEPLQVGLLQKVGPLSKVTIKQILGITAL